MGRYLFVLVALVWLGGIGAFFLYVSFFSVLSCGLVVTGLAVMFVLGVQVGSVAGTRLEDGDTEILALPRTNSLHILPPQDSAIRNSLKP